MPIPGKPEPSGEKGEAWVTIGQIATQALGSLVATGIYNLIVNLAEWLLS